MKTKRLCLIAVLALLSSLSASAYDFVVEGIYYSVVSEDEGTCEVSTDESQTDVYSGRVDVPSQVVYNGKEYVVSAIGYNAFSHCSNLTTVIVPESVRNIGDYAFSYSRNLARIIIKSANYFAGSWSPCSGCSPALVTYVPSLDCQGWGTRVVYPYEVFSTDDAVYMITNPAYRCCDLISYDGSEANFVIPESVAFNSNVSLTVENVGKSAFAHSQTLESLTFNSYGSLGGKFVYGCNSLKSFTFGEKVKDIQHDAFDGNLSLLFFSVSETNPLFCSVNGVVFTKDRGTLMIAPRGIDACEIPEGTAFIFDKAFAGCQRLLSVRLPDGCGVGNAAFMGCENLKTVEIGRNCYEIGARAFKDNASLTNLKIGIGCSRIGNEAFANCPNLETLKIPYTVVTIGERAFQKDEKLKKVVLGQSVREICYQAFQGCQNIKELTSMNTIPPACGIEALNGISAVSCEINVPSSALENYKNAEPWNNFWNLQAVELNSISKQPTKDYLSVGMKDGEENVSYQWHGLPRTTTIVTPQSYGDRAWKRQEDGTWRSAEDCKIGETSEMFVSGIYLNSSMQTMPGMNDGISFDYSIDDERDCLRVFWGTNENYPYNIMLAEIRGNSSGWFDTGSCPYDAGLFDQKGFLTIVYVKNSDSEMSGAVVYNVYHFNAAAALAYSNSLQAFEIEGATDKTLDTKGLVNVTDVYCDVILDDVVVIRSDQVLVVDNLITQHPTERELSVAVYNESEVVGYQWFDQNGALEGETKTSILNDSFNLGDSIYCSATLTNGIILRSDIVYLEHNNFAKQPTEESLTVEMRYKDDLAKYEWFAVKEAIYDFVNSPSNERWANWEQEDDVWVGRAGYDPSSMTAKNVTLNAGDVLSFDYHFYFNGSCPGFWFTWNGRDIYSYYSGNGYDLTVSDSFTYTATETSTADLTISHRGDTGGSDARISNIKINGKPVFGDTEKIDGEETPSLSAEKVPGYAKEVYCKVTSRFGQVLRSNRVSSENQSGIAEISTSRQDSQFYDLQGRKVTKPVKGIYISNGKKICFR